MVHSSAAVCSGCEKKLEGAHPYLGEWFRKKKAQYTNVHISWAFRGQLDQMTAFREGRTRLQWPNSPHNNMKDEKPFSLALDLFLINEDGEARYPPLFYAKLNEENKTDREPIRWGGEFKDFGDLDHFQLNLDKITA